MSAAQRVAPLATSLRPLFRSSLSSPAHPQGICLRCLRAYRSQHIQPIWATTMSGRSLATEAAQYRPHSLDSQPPPRNGPVSETSIAGGQNRSNEARMRESDNARAANPSSNITEAEAQSPKSSPNKAGGVGSVATPDVAPGKPQRKSKLRPRKAAMRLTPAAVDALRELLDQPEPKLIRVGVKNRGCSGLAYHLEYVDKPGAFDEAVDQDGVKVLVDSKALFSIIGSEMDWVEDKLSRRFVFNNPNITEQCGCGESFSIG